MQTTKPVIGWIGPGIMGKPMCKNLMQALVAQGDGGLDSSALAKIVQRQVRT